MMHFYICKHCGNIIAMIRACGVPVYCCGEKMQEIKPNTSQAAQEKHIPVYEVKGATVTVSVGKAEHPMTPEHFIEWICLETESGIQLKKLKPNTPPCVDFTISGDDKVKAVYAFCNQHSLWNTQ